MNKKQIKSLCDDINWKLENEEIDLSWLIGIMEQHGFLEE